MVFAVWAGRKECVSPDLAPPFLESCRFGLSHLEEIIRLEAEARGVPQVLAREYLTRCITFELGERDYEGLRLFLQHASEFAIVEPPGKVSA
jgi:predicted solute-binding protein